MNREQKRKFCKFSTILGIVIIMLPNAVILYWGNLSVYVNSYIVVCLDTISGVEEPWLASVYACFWNLTVMFYDPMRACIGKRWTAILFIVIIDVGIFSTYFTVQTSFVLMIVTLGAMPAIGAGILQAYTLREIVDWADKDAGFLFSIAQSSFYWGSSVLNQVTTLYLNPDNFLPNYSIENSLYFTNWDILNKVPSLFLVLGGFAVGCHMIGFLLIRENTFDKKNQDTPCEEVDMSGNQVNAYNSLEGNTRDEVKTVSPALEDNKPIRNDYTPKEMLKTGSFYALWAINFFIEFPFLLLANYYKSFGQIWIHDDHFLTNLGTVLSFVNIVVGILWGYALDKMGGRASLLLVLFSAIYLSVWYYFTAMVDKWLYFIITNLLSAFTGALFSSIAHVAVYMYGETHFSHNYGLLRSSTVLLSIVCPFITNAILAHFGWFYVFSFTSFLNAIGLVLMLFCVPKF